MIEEMKLKYCKKCKVFILTSALEKKCPACGGSIEFVSKKMLTGLGIGEKLKKQYNDVKAFMDALLGKQGKVDTLEQLQDDLFQAQKKGAVSFEDPRKLEYYSLLNDFLRNLSIYSGTIGGPGFLFLNKRGELWGARDLMSFNVYVVTAVANVYNSLVLELEPIYFSTLETFTGLHMLLRKQERWSSGKLFNLLDRLIILCGEKLKS